MDIQKDFKELLELFNAHKVEYLIVGGYALAFHGAPRFTGDIDVLVKADGENAKSSASQRRPVKRSRSWKITTARPI